MCDNIAVIGYTNKMGGIKIIDSCNKMHCKIRVFCITEKLRVSGAHIPGTSNKEAEKQSEILDDFTGWQINP